MFRLKSSLLFMVVVSLALAGFQLLAVPRCCMAQGSAEENLDAEISKVDEAAGKDAGKAEEALQEQFGVQKEEIQSLLNDKLSYGNIAALLAVSSASGKAKQDVLGSVKSGKKWGEIAGQYGVDLGVVIAKVQEVGSKVSGEAVAKPKRKMKFAPGT